MKIIKTLSSIYLLLIAQQLACSLVDTAVIPCAGLGTRLLPLSKSVPKELAPILDKPAIQYVIEEAIKAGLKKFCIVTNPDKVAIEKYFSHNYKLERELRNKGKLEFVENLNKIIDSSEFVYPNQLEPLGLGHAILMSKKYIHTEFLAILLPDDIYDPEDSILQKLLTVAEEYNASVIAVQEVPLEKISAYGVIAYEAKLNNNVFKIKNLVEKPKKEFAPSNLAIVGRYILHKNIFDSIEKISKLTTEGEIQLTDAIADLIENGQTVLAIKIDEARHDVGNLEGLIKANYLMGQKSKYLQLEQ